MPTPADGSGERNGRRYPIAVAARRAGLTKDVLRAWERRYRAVRPQRMENGRRRYSGAEIERLQLLARLTDGGQLISELAGLETAELLELVRDEDLELARDEDDRAARPAGKKPNRARAHLRTCVTAAIDLDGGALRDELDRALISLDPVVLIDEVLSPLMVRLGALWSDGRLNPGQERIATGAVTATLSRLIETLQPGGPGTLLVAGTLTGQRHELGAMLAAASAAAEGWRVTYLGPELPAEDFARAASVKGARVVALGVVIPDDDPNLAEELMRLARTLPPEVSLVVGGTGAPAYADVLELIGACTVSTLADFRVYLDGVNTAPAKPR